MPIFHFNVHDGVSLPDPDGHDLPDVEAAKSEAINLAGNLISEMGSDFWLGEEWKMEVTDASGLILFSLCFFASVAPAGTTPARVG